MTKIRSGAEMLREDIYKLAIDKHGLDNQLNMAIEEMAELIQAINKTRRYPNSLKAKEDVAEEIADVFIMLEQLILIYDCDELVDNIKDLKVRRLLKRLIDN